MTMSDEGMKPMLERVRESYNVPPETPREQMWQTIESRIASTGGGDAPVGAERPAGVDAASPTHGGGSAGSGVIDLDAVRRQRVGPTHRMTGWAVAAAAVLVMGIGIGRMTAPVGPATVATTEGRDPGARSGTMTLAARDHLGRSESLLTMVLADARAGRVDPETSEWARGLLGQTRLLMDSGRDVDPSVEALLLDLELVLIQIVGVADTGSMDEARAQTELELALRSLENGEVLTRIQAVLPADMAGA